MLRIMSEALYLILASGCFHMKSRNWFTYARVSSVGAFCCAVIADNAIRMVGLTARAWYKKLPIICCMRFLPAALSNGLVSLGVIA